MTSKHALMKRLRPALALICVCALPCAAIAQDSLTRSFSNAFETIVIDASKAAAKATSAAKGAMAGTERKGSKKTRKESDAAEGQTPSDIELPIRKPRPVYGKAKDVAPHREAAPAPTAKPKTSGRPAETAKATPKPTKQPEPAKKAEPAKAAPKTDEWPAQDVELARARCTQLLKGLDVVTIPEPPMRKGDCGAHAPVRLISIGKDPEVAISPPAVVSCDMVVALHKWVTQDVQPLAKRHLGAKVIKMEAMSDYSCRMAYGRVGNKLSEHGKANALDIGGFMTAKGKTAHLLTGWGPNRRDIAREIAAAKAAEAKKAAEKAAAEAAAQAEATAKGKAVPRATIVEGLPKPEQKPTNPLAKQAALHVGAPEAAATKSTKAADAKKKKKTRRGELPPEILEHMPKDRAAPKDNTARFLHAAHDAACKIFGTTLGPEANEAHRNHFHVDMAPRKVTKICR